MLRHLTVIDFAIVKRADLEFRAEMSVLTGETGAGKSVLVDALSLAVGERAVATNIRAGARRADVSAVFEIHTRDEIKTWLSEHHLEDADECILRRTLSQDGRSRAYINGRPVPVSTLRELGDRLVDIHGQHLHQSLLKNEIQRQLLDDFADLDTLRETVRAHHHSWASAVDELKNLSGPKNDREAKLELLRYQADELEALALQIGEFQSLSEEQRRLAHVNELMTLGTTALERLDADSSAGVILNLQECLRDIGDMCTHYAAVQGVLSLLREATIQVEEASSDLRGQVNNFEPDPQRLQSIDERLSNTLDIARKHRVSVDELPETLEHIKSEIAALTNSESRIKTLNETIHEQLTGYRSASATLTQSRKIAATRLSEKVSQHLSRIGMPGGVFSVSVRSDNEGDPRANGADKIEFIVATNPGQPALALSRIASGGELSRISLALQLVTVEGTGVPTIIFDEVDAGIGGAVAEVVGQQMRFLGERRQVLCVTHLAQVASQAHHHVQVEKRAGTDSVDTHFEHLTDEARVEEVARMIGGVDITKQTLAHAREMLKHADKGERPVRG